MTKKSLQKLMQLEAFQLVFKQLTGVLIIAIIALPLTGLKESYSILAGGLAYGLPNLIFVWRVFKHSGAKQMNQFVSAFFIFEMFKLILSGIFFLLVVKYLPVSLLSVLVGFIGAIISFWIASLFCYGKNKPAQVIAN